ncbi:MAG: tRNA (adenosine(37)-N6)-threonylcarbamoyltransferase complex ATPase subunit type 1 TsaE [Holosporaceae bacterium]|jgi:tRNA threonylcarbamoyladenosine biosynthesis protein TsaE|nr:tRNA (adenosine(37)-N6)-threonylcarbamoyltransferase complex ATPase subunit type 1 TsaE [Holosporaceae bacterium]
MTEFIYNSLMDPRKSAEYFAQFAKTGQCFALSGDLGSGKTTFASYLIRLLTGSIEEVPSPTFSVVQIYESPTAVVWHIDCYRLKSQDEFFELGLEEALSSGITIIEWPELVLPLLPANTIKILFRPNEFPC